MWKIKGNDIKMNRGDFGIKLPITITNVLTTDTIKFEIRNLQDELIINKNLPCEEEKWVLEFTEEESNSLKDMCYLYSIMQYRDGVLQNTINKNSLFEIE